MCRINLKKVEARRPNALELKPEQKVVVVENAGTHMVPPLEHLLSNTHPLFDESLFSLNPGLFTPLGLSSLGSSDAFPFPEVEQLPQAPSNLSHLEAGEPTYQDLLSSHSLGFESEAFLPLPEEASAPSTNHHHLSHSLPLPHPHSHFHSQDTSPVPSSPLSSDFDLPAPPHMPPQAQVFKPTLPAKGAHHHVPPSSSGGPSCAVQQRASSEPADEEYLLQANSRKRTARNPLITDDKRERNRLAAEKYRRKGRELVSTLEVKCNELSKENSELRDRNHMLEEEIQYLRSLLSESRSLPTAESHLSAPFCH